MVTQATPLVKQEAAEYDIEVFFDRNNKAPRPDYCAIAGVQQNGVNSVAFERLRPRVLHT